jgi:hypothetical protein
MRQASGWTVPVSRLPWRTRHRRVWAEVERPPTSRRRRRSSGCARAGRGLDVAECDRLIEAFRRDERVAHACGRKRRAGRVSPTTAAHELLAAHGGEDDEEDDGHGTKGEHQPQIRRVGATCGPATGRAAASARAGSGCRPGCRCRGPGVLCNVCRWQDGVRRGGPTAGALCPPAAQRSDRFLHWCLAQRVALTPALRVIECSPRLGDAYRAAMSTWFFYRTSDYDLRAHRGNLQLDLQAIDLPDACLDVMLCAHVLEHVPITSKALVELRRVMAPGGPCSCRCRSSGPHRSARRARVPRRRHAGVLALRLRPDRPAAGRRLVTDLLCTAELADAVASPEAATRGRHGPGSSTCPRCWRPPATPGGGRRPGGGGRPGRGPHRRRAGLHVPDLGLPGADLGGRA